MKFALALLCGLSVTEVNQKDVSYLNAYSLKPTNKIKSSNLVTSGCTTACVQIRNRTCTCCTLCNVALYVSSKIVYINAENHSITSRNVREREEGENSI